MTSQPWLHLEEELVRRSILLSMVILGGVVTAVAGTGTFAPFTDRATTGTNAVASGTRPKAADLKIISPGVSVDCTPAPAPYVDDSTTATATLTDAQPGSRQTLYVCLKNAGASALTISQTTTGVVEIDNACTGDEASVDQTCGGDAAGELGSVVFWESTRYDCTSGGGPLPLSGNTLAAPTPVSLGTLAPNEVGCYITIAEYTQNRPAEDVQRAQSDTVTWKYTFDATT